MQFRTAAMRRIVHYSTGFPWILCSAMPTCCNAASRALSPPCRCPSWAFPPWTWAVWFSRRPLFLLRRCRR